MKKSYKFIKFVPHGSDPSMWRMINKKHNTILGVVYYAPNWKQHVIEYAQECVFSKSCTDDISNFLEQLNQANKSTG